MYSTINEGECMPDSSAYSAADDPQCSVHYPIDALVPEMRLYDSRNVNIPYCLYRRYLRYFLAPTEIGAPSR